jgi:aspartate aminotransferase-like enzyme
MSRKKGKAVSFDAMVKFFMQHYNIPTKKDVDRMMAKLDRLENLIKTAMASPAFKLKGQPGQRQPTVTAVDMVFDLISRSQEGLGFSDIQIKTGFGDKKIRNIIFRLNKIGKIKRKRRGTYVAV